MLSLAFAVTGGSVDQECLGYRGQAISYIRRKMTSLSDATSESTIGAILLLAGVEVRTSDYPPCLCIFSCAIIIFAYAGSTWNDLSRSSSYAGRAAAT